MEDIKSMMNAGKNEWGIQGYYVQKTPHFFKKSAIISPEKRVGPTKEEKTRASMPDPTKYADDYQKSHEKYWKKANGKFLGSKKDNFLDNEIKRSKSNPGPGQYLKNDDKKKEDYTKASPLGRFDKSEKLSFLTTVESYAEETPSCWKYATTKEATKNHSLRWIKPKIKTKQPKQEIGPGKYSEGVNKALAKTMLASPKYSIPKSKTPSTLGNKTFEKNNTPGVGSYKEADKAYFKHVSKKARVALILPYKLKSFTDMIVKQSSQTPGPGAYETYPSAKK